MNSVDTARLCVLHNEREFWLTYPKSPEMKWVLRQVFKGNEYPLVFPASFKPSLIVDIGGNVGAAAIWFHGAYPEARIVSYEPSRELFVYLKANTEALPNIQVNNFGLSDHNTKAALHIGSRNVAQNSLFKTDASGEKTEEVEIRCAVEAIEHLEAAEISILKIDTEGSEVPIIKSIVSWLNRISAVFVEYHSEADRREIDGLLAEHFYLIHASIQHPNLGSLVYFSRSQTENHGLRISIPINRSSGCTGVEK